jgi:hypothetical protein
MSRRASLWSVILGWEDWAEAEGSSAAAIGMRGGYTEEPPCFCRRQSKCAASKTASLQPPGEVGRTRERRPVYKD